VVISGGGQSFVYQILNPSLGLQAPDVGNPIGQTSIQGAVTDTSVVVATPEPSTLACMFAGLGLLGFARRRLTK
jgi:hypothetical protein